MVAVLTFASLAAGFMLQDDNNDLSADGDCGANLEWSYVGSTSTLTISGTGPMNDYDSNANEAPWNIGYYITKVVINGATSIGNYAFYNMNSIVSVEMSSSVTSIGDFAFYTCMGLKNIEFSPNLESIGEKAFYSCYQLNNILLPNGLVAIDDGAFYYCVALTSITIPSTVTLLGENAFGYDTALKTVTIENGLTTIGDGAFEGCTKIESVTIPSSVTTIGEDAFSNCTSLKSLILPGVTNIGESAFDHCSALESIHILAPGAVNVGGWAFNGNQAVTEIYIAGTLGTVGTYAFQLGTGTGPGEKAICTVYSPNLTQLPNNSFSSYWVTFTFESEMPAAKYDVSYELIGAPSSVTAPKTSEHAAGSTVTIPNLSADGYSISIKMNGSTITGSTFTMPGEDASVVVTYTPRYSLKFYTDEGKTDLYATTYADSGTAPVAPSGTPTKEPVGEISYTFVKWTGFSGVSSVTGNMEFVAEFSETTRTYDIRFKVDYSFVKEEALEKGATITKPSTDPTKVSTDEFSYTFVRWIDFEEEMVVTGDQTFEAEFLPVKKSYTVTFVLEDEISIAKQETLEYGTVIEKPATDPTKTSTDEFSYTFKEWLGFDEGMTVWSTHFFIAVFETEKQVYTITFNNDDGTLYAEYDLEYGETITVPTTDPAKGSTPQYDYSFTGWNGFVADMTVTGDVTLIATFSNTTRSYTVTFVLDDGVTIVQQETEEYGTVITAPSNDPTKAQTVGETFSFAGWKDFTAGMTVEGNKTFTAEFTPAVRMYTVKFVRIGGNTFDEKSLGYETNVQTPSTSPEYAPSGAFSYEFDGWVDSVTKAVLLTTTKVNGDMTFEPVYKQILNVDANGLDDLTDDDGTIIVEGRDDQLTLSKDALAAIDNNLSSETGANALKVSAGDGTIEFDRTSVGVLKDRETNLNLSIVKVDNSILTDAAKAKAGDRPVYAINVGAISDFNGGVLKITLKYDLQDGEDASKLVIWNLKADGSVESFDCVYDEVAGTVTFETTHLSNYCIAFASADDDDGFPILFVAIAVVAILAVLIVVYFLFIKKKA